MELKTKVCSNCGAEYYYKTRIGTCPVCKTPFEYGPCCGCGEYGKLLYGKFCYKCADKFYGMNERTKAAFRERAAEHKKQAGFWLACINKVPNEYPRLTTEQWLAACSHFGGCAKCESKDISARGYFIPFQLGGRYCDWNVIPLCERCASTYPPDSNPLEYYAYRPIWGTPGKYEATLLYLGPKLLEACKLNDK